jgi:general secretion pathway protein G
MRSPVRKRIGDPSVSDASASHPLNDSRRIRPPFNRLRIVTMFDSQRSRTRRGFTLIEVLIVVVILGILAAIVIPQYVSAEGETQEAAVKKDLQALRSQIGYYYFKENAYPATLQALVDDGYLSAFPDHPGADGNWNYNAATGEITSSLDATW